MTKCGSCTKELSSNYLKMQLIIVVDGEQGKTVAGYFCNLECFFDWRKKPAEKEIKLYRAIKDVVKEVEDES